MSYLQCYLLIRQQLRKTNAIRSLASHSARSVPRLETASLNAVRVSTRMLLTRPVLTATPSVSAAMDPTTHNVPTAQDYQTLQFITTASTGTALAILGLTTTRLTINARNATSFVMSAMDPQIKSASPVLQVGSFSIRATVSRTVAIPWL